jgi:hypothetical protein
MKPVTTMKTSGGAMLLILATVSASHAFDFTGANLELMQTNSPSFSASILRSSANYDLGSGVGLQFGGAYKVGSDDNVDTTLEAHFLKSEANGLTYGAFVGQEDLAGDLYKYAGVEFALQQGPLNAELSYSHYWDTDPSDPWKLVTLDVGYDVTEQLTLLTGYASDVSANDDDTYAYVGASYDIAPNMALQATFGNDEGIEENVVAVGLTINLGQGAQMRQRSYATYFPHY